MLKVSRKFIFVLLLITLIIELPLYARADMGAKPSITLKVVNAPADYYVGLLGYRGQSEAANSVLYVEKYDEESVDEYLRGFHLDGWMYSLSPVGPSMYPASEEGSYYFFYSIPRPFRVILIAEDGRVYVSEIMDQKEYNSDCTYDVSCGIVTEDLAGKTANRISYIVLCYVLTILIELFMLWVFQYPLYRRNLIRFLVINTITQISLNIYLANAVPGLV